VRSPRAEAHTTARSGYAVRVGDTDKMPSYYRANIPLDQMLIMDLLKDGSHAFDAVRMTCTPCKYIYVYL
jgi:hypothetical protein